MYFNCTSMRRSRRHSSRLQPNSLTGMAMLVKNEVPFCPVKAGPTYLSHEMNFTDPGAKRPAELAPQMLCVSLSKNRRGSMLFSALRFIPALLQQAMDCASHSADHRPPPTKHGVPQISFSSMSRRIWINPLFRIAEFPSVLKLMSVPPLSPLVAFSPNPVDISVTRSWLIAFIRVFAYSRIRPYTSSITAVRG